MDYRGHKKAGKQGKEENGREWKGAAGEAGRKHGQNFHRSLQKTVLTQTEGKQRWAVAFTKTGENRAVTHGSNKMELIGDLVNCNFSGFVGGESGAWGIRDSNK